MKRTPLTVIDALNTAAKLLEEISQTPRLDAEILMSDALHIQRHRLPLHHHHVIKNKDYAAFKKMVSRRLTYEPIAYIIQSKEFYSLPFNVNKHVLIPRPETELLVDCAIYYAKQYASVIDIGTGSGAIAIAIKHNRPDCRVYAADISLEALRVAKMNARTIVGKSKITFLHSNLFDAVPVMPFDLIASNPPYINPDIYPSLQKDIHYEPKEALTAPDEGFAIIRSLLDSAVHRLAMHGIMIIEIDESLADRIRHYTKSFPFTISILKDYAGLQRIAIIKK